MRNTIDKTKTTWVVEYIENNPGVTNHEIANALNIQRDEAASVTTRLFLEGRLRRQKTQRFGPRSLFCYWVTNAKQTKCTENMHRVPQKSTPTIDALVDSVVEEIVGKVRSKVKARFTELFGDVI